MRNGRRERDGSSKKMNGTETESFPTVKPPDGSNTNSRFWQFSLTDPFPRISHSIGRKHERGRHENSTREGHSDCLHKGGGMKEEEEEVEEEENQKENRTEKEKEEKREEKRTEEDKEEEA